jgi:allantoinase
MGRPYRIRQLRRALEHVARYRDRIWLARPGEICAHIEGLPRGIMPGSDEA